MNVPKRKLKYWGSSVPAKDDFGLVITQEFIDGKTRSGPWAIMAPGTFVFQGMGLGLGLGQRYQLQPDGQWLKVEG